MTRRERAGNSNRAAFGAPRKDIPRRFGASSFSLAVSETSRPGMRRASEPDAELDVSCLGIARYLSRSDRCISIFWACHSVPLLRSFRARNASRHSFVGPDLTDVSNPLGPTRRSKRGLAAFIVRLRASPRTVRGHVRGPVSARGAPRLLQRKFCVVGLRPVALPCATIRAAPCCEEADTPSLDRDGIRGGPVPG